MSNRGQSTDPELGRAVQSHKRGGLAEAERLYRAVLLRDASNGIALSNLGILFAQTGRMQEAVVQFQRAVEIDPKSADKRVFLGNALKEVGDLNGAVDQYQQALRLDPRSQQTNFLAGNVLLKLGRAQEAIPYYRQCLEGSPRNPDVLLNLGLAHYQTGEFEEAIRCHEGVAQINPKSASAWLNLGDAYLAIQDFQASASALDTGLRLAPKDPAGWASLCEALLGVGDLEQAFVAIERSLKLQGEDPKALFMRARVLQLQKKSDLAAAAYRKVLEHAPDQSSARFNLGILLAEQSRQAEAKSEFEYVANIEGDPTAEAAKVRRTLVVPIISESVEQIVAVRSQMLSDLKSMRRNPPQLSDPQSQIGNPAFYLAYQGGNNRELMTEIAALLTDSTPELVWTAPHCSGSKRRDNRIKVGFISAHLREHTVGRITAGLIKNLDRKRFEVIVMRPAGSSDEYSGEIDAMADRSVELPRDARTAREVVAGHKLDAIYYPDIGMEPFTYYLAFSRLAPVQAVGWGHADTTGIPNVDFYLSSIHFEPVDGQDQYSEKLISLPRINCYYPKPGSEFEKISRSELSLPEGVPIYICPQSAFKLHPEIDEALDDLLRLDTKGIVALSSGTEPHWNELLMQRFKRTIPDRFERIRFIPRVPPEKFRGLLALADAIIDPKHFTGGHTTYMAFATGVPVVTWDGNHMRGRMTRGLYEQMGIKGPVARNSHEFAQMAVRLANDQEWRTGLSLELKEKSILLFEDIQAVRDFEEFIAKASELS